MSEHPPVAPPGGLPVVTSVDAPLAGDLAVPLPSEVHPIKLDAVVHERFRLAILSALARHESVSFLDLTRHLGMTYGNLHIHAKRLEEVGYIQSTKHGEGRDTRTTFAITRAGRKALERYVGQMDAILARLRRALTADR